MEIKGGKDGCDKALLATKGKQVDGELPAAEDQTKSCERPSHAHLLRVSAGPEQSPLSSLSNPRVQGGGSQGSGGSSSALLGSRSLDNGAGSTC